MHTLPCKVLVQQRRYCKLKVNLIVRKARCEDFKWVESIMQNTLEPYYGGDHRAHAKRIFDAHIAGGVDDIGFFSSEQCMFIAEIDGENVGMIHLVGKRQATYKISPLIVDSKFQGRLGIGSSLFKYAEDYARKHQAHQIYCTVAEKNTVALQFFFRKGFIKAGSSDSHYKIGMTETMLYKPLHEVSKVISLDQLHVSVLPLDETDDELKERVGRLLLDKLQDSFEGITDDWIRALFDGYDRRGTLDINAKYKLIYVAVNSTGRVIGVVGATPKKGNPIKLMPLIATNIVAFEALLIDIPYQLVSYGHKLYIHINPTVDEVISLQRLGWKLNAVMPSAYCRGVITQQWSFNIGEKTMRKMRIKQRFYNLILSGKKPLEVRVGYDSINKIKVGEDICLITNTESSQVKVKDIRRYKTFEEMLAVEPWQSIVPDARDYKEVLRLLRQIYPAKKEKLGVVVFEFGKISK